MARRWLLTGCVAPPEVFGLPFESWPMWWRSLLAGVSLVWLTYQLHMWWAGVCDKRRVWQWPAGVSRRLDVGVRPSPASPGGSDLVFDGGNAGAGSGAPSLGDGDPHPDSGDPATLLAELRQALLVDNQLILAFQPAVALETGAPVGVEALVRWRHPRLGLLHPDAFVEAVERSDLVGAFSRHVLDMALRIAAEWAAEGLVMPMAVNLSARNLLEPELPDVVAETLDRYGVPPDQLILEITETVMLDSSPVIDEVLVALRKFGVRIAVDDFGTGYSSLTVLTRFQVDEVKVDRAFVSKMAVSPEAAAIVRTTVELGRSLGLRVVAEGVETAEQRLALLGMGCTAAQGYHFSPPLLPDKASAALATLARAARV